LPHGLKAYYSTMERLYEGHATMSATEYATNYPRYCRTCCGIGGEKADASKFPSNCPDCYEKGLCARCAEPVPRYEATCTACGWRAFNVADALPGGDYT
jgi:hypothetical protein